MALTLTSYVNDQLGAAKVGLTVEAWNPGGGAAVSSTTTDANGRWQFAALDIAQTWRIKIIDGTKVLWQDARAQVQLTTADFITSINTDTINEHTAATGVTIDGVKLKDGAIVTGSYTGTVIGPAYGGTGVANNAASTITITGAFALGLTISAGTSLTLPTAGTVATLAGTEELDNKTLDASVAKGTWTASGTWTIPAVTLAGAVAGGGQAFTNVGDMTFAAGKALASGSTNTDTLLLKANDTTVITITTGATDSLGLAAVNSLVAIANLDIGAFDLRAATLTADGLTPGRVVFSTTNGQLADDSDMTFATDTLTVTKIAAHTVTGLLTGTVAGLPASLTNTSDAASVQVLRLDGDRATPTADDKIYISHYLSNSAGTQIEYSRWLTDAASITNPNEAGSMRLQPRIAGGTFADVFRLSGSALDINADGVTFRLYLGSPGTLMVGAVTARSVTQPTQAINVFNGTAPAGTLANGFSFYSAAGQAVIMDSLGAAATLSGSHVSWSAGLAVTAAGYWVGRDADATNQLHMNVPTGATMEWSINDVAQLTLNATGITTVGNVGIGTAAIANPDKLVIASGNILMDHSDQVELRMRNTGLANNPIFKVGRIAAGGDGDPGWHFMYQSGAVVTERDVMVVDMKGIIASIKPAGAPGSMFEGFNAGDTNPLFRLNSSPAMQLEFGVGGGTATDTFLRRTAAGTISLLTANNAGLTIAATGTSETAGLTLTARTAGPADVTVTLVASVAGALTITPAASQEVAISQATGNAALTVRATGTSQEAILSLVGRTSGPADVSGTVYVQADGDFYVNAASANLYLNSVLGYVILGSTKATTGDPASPVEGMIYTNAFDNVVKMYADGGWRTLASGW